MRSSRERTLQLLVALAFIAASQPVQATSGSCLSSRGISFSSCDGAASEFTRAGCSCYTCTETDGQVYASCSSPFSCSLTSTGNYGSEIEMGNKEYGIVFAVYLATAAVVWGAAKLIAEFFPHEKKGASTKDLVMQAMPPATRFVYKHSFASFIQEDGSPTGFVDYLCDEKELFGFLDCRKKTAAVRPRCMRFLAIVSTLMVTISLAFLLGTVVYNNESCSSTQVVSYCHSCACKTYCNGVDLGCTDCQCKPNNGCQRYSCLGAISEISSDSASSVTTSVCQGASVENSDKAKWVTMFLTLAVSWAGSAAVQTAEDGSRRQKLFLAGNTVAAIAYSASLSKEATDEDAENANQRRLEAIGTTLLAGWWYEQLVGFGAIISYFVCYRVIYHTMYRPRLEEVKRAGAAAVHPHDAQELDDSIMKTEGVKGGVGNPVTIDEVRLQAPTQQQLQCSG